MNRYALLLAGLVLATMITIVWTATRPLTPSVPDMQVSRPKPPNEVRSPMLVAKHEAPPTSSPGKTVTEGEGAPQFIQEAEAAKERILRLAVTADPAVLPKLVPFLEHPGATVRAETVTALLLLGEPGAAPSLHAAAERATIGGNAEEANTLREAANFLAKRHPLEPRLTPRPEPQGNELRVAPSDAVKIEAGKTTDLSAIAPK